MDGMSVSMWREVIGKALRLLRARPWMAFWPGTLAWLLMTPKDEVAAYVNRALNEEADPHPGKS